MKLSPEAKVKIEAWSFHSERIRSNEWRVRFKFLDKCDHCNSPVEAKEYTVALEERINPMGLRDALINLAALIEREHSNDM